MAEALSQNQIDELLKQMQSGKVDAEIDTAPKIKEYDFKSPKKFTKEQLKALDSLHENFSRGLSSYFTSILHNVCEVSVLQIEEQRYYEFSNALPENTLVGVIELQSEDGKVADTSFIMDVSASFSFMTIDRLLGGNGRLIVPDRNFTEIEMAIMEDVVQAMIQYLEEAWCNYIPVTTTLNSIETNARLLQTYSPQEIVVIVALDVQLPDFKGAITLCFPAEGLEGVVDSFKIWHSRSSKQQDANKDQEQQVSIMETIKQSDLEIGAVLDRFEMSLEDILQLQVQDVIALNKKIDDNIDIMVEGEPWYHAKLGKSKLKKSIKLIDTIAK